MTEQEMMSRLNQNSRNFVVEEMIKIYCSTKDENIKLEILNRLVGQNVYF